MLEGGREEGSGRVVLGYNDHRRFSRHLKSENNLFILHVIAHFQYKNRH